HPGGVEHRREVVEGERGLRRAVAAVQEPALGVDGTLPADGEDLEHRGAQLTLVVAEPARPGHRVDAGRVGAGHAWMIRIASPRHHPGTWLLPPSRDRALLTPPGSWDGGRRSRSGTLMVVRKALVMERVRSDVEVLARAGLEVQAFLDEIDTSLARAVPHDGLCVTLQDPVTALPTATFKLGGLRDRETHDLHWCEIEFGADDATAFRRLTLEGVIAVGVHEATGGHPDRSL